MKILTTGGRGFIAESLRRFLNSGDGVGGNDAHVMALGRSQQEPSGSSEYVQVDPTAENLAPILQDFAPDLIVHAAGSASVGASVTGPLDDLRASVLTTANLFEAVRRSATKPLVIIPSSASVYGNPGTLPVNENAPLEPISPYGFHKAMCELLAREYSTCFGVDVVACRFFSLFGPAQRRLLIWELYRQLAGPEPIVWLEGTGTESRDFLHIDDAVRAILDLAAQRSVESPSGSYRVLNFGRGVETTVLEIAQQLRTLVAPGKEIRCRGNARPGDPLRWQADISRLQSVLPQWKPGPLVDDLARCVDEWKAEARVSQHGS